MQFLIKDNNGNYWIKLKHNTGENFSYCGNCTTSTVFQKLRFDPSTMLINTADLTYSSTNGVEIPIATAASCTGDSIADGTAGIDLSGTNFDSLV